MRILICNDDGIYSPGIAALAEVASEHGTVRIVAPHVEQSSMGHAITANRPLSYRRTKIGGFDAYRVNGTPADCVALGKHHWNVDVVLSGCNLGFNIGNGIWHSGTLAAAKQATLFGIRGIALSTPSTAPGGGEPDFAVITPAAERHLICGRCTLRWKYEPLTCPYCQNAERTRITSFATPDGQYRVYACDVCRRYLKAYDGRRASRPVMPMVDTVATLPLDAAAMQRGYSS